MSKAIAKETRPHGVDTEDRLMEGFLRLAAWAEKHRRVTLILGLTVVGAVVAGFYYMDYRAQLMDRAAVRLQEIRGAAASADRAALRDELQLYLAQYGGTPYGNEARVLLGDLELRRDSLRAAIAALEPAADLATQSPVAFAAAWMLAAAKEQAGDVAGAMDWYQRLEARARFDYQRHRALAEQARLHVSAGRYGPAVSIYERLVPETEGDETGELYGVLLGEARALQEAGAAPRAMPGATSPEGTPPEAEGPSAPSAE